MKNLRIFIYFLRLVRWPNLLIVMATMFLMRYGVLQSLLNVNGLKLQTPFSHFVLLVAATMLITAAGYIINDYFDRKTDLINKPYKVIVGRFIKRRAAMFMHVVFSSLGVLLGSYISFKNNLGSLSIVFILATGILWFYSTSYKRQVLVGNLVVAVMTAAVPLLVIMFEYPLLNLEYVDIVSNEGFNFKHLLYWVSGFAYFAFFTTMVREIVKDVEDMEGDQAYGRVSIPMSLGIESTKIILAILMSIVLISVLVCVALYLFDYYSLLYLSISIVMPGAYFIYMIWKANEKTHYSKASGLLKLIMVMGVLYALMVRIIIQTM
jgi:4-hydroxybenzoate polyprenyltransferase